MPNQKSQWITTGSGRRVAIETRVCGQHFGRVGVLCAVHGGDPLATATGPQGEPFPYDCESRAREAAQELAATL